MSSKWKAKLKNLQHRLKAWREASGTDYYWGCIHAAGSVRDLGDGAQIELAAAGGRIVDRIDVPLANSFQRHYMFDTGNYEKAKQGLAGLREAFSGAGETLETLPRKIMLRSQLPSLENGLDEDLVRWLLALASIGNRYEQHSYIVEVEFSGNGERPCFRPWRELSTVLGCAPLEIIAVTDGTNNDFHHWQQRFREQGRQFPALIAVSLSKPIYYASLNLIDHLMAGGVDEQKSAKTSNPQRRRDNERSNSTELVLAALLEHHHQEPPVLEPILQKQLSANSGVSQSTVSRTLGTLFRQYAPNSSVRNAAIYELLCKQKKIISILENLEMPSDQRLRDVGDLDRFDRSAHAMLDDDGSRSYGYDEDDETPG